MNTAVIELNDAEVTLFRAGEVVASSPGIAVLREDRVELGQAALAATHIDPRNTFSRFWSDLNQDDFKRHSKLARHNADLAYSHLLSLHEMADGVEQVALAVPGSFSAEQLALLLGLLEASPFTAVGLVDSAVAALAATAGAGSYVHLDIHLHHTVVTSLEVSDTVQRTAVRVVNEVGLLEIQDRCVNHVADLFIRQSRFDPLHHAVTEQALCNKMAQCLYDLGRGADTQVDIEFEQARYQARVNRERLVAALQPLYDKISAAVDSDRVVLLHPRLAGLPAVVEHLARVTPQVDMLDARAVYAGCMGYVQQESKADAEIYFVTQLAATAQPAIGVTAPTALAQQPEAGPTHVLAGAEAYPLGATPLYLSAQGAPAQSDSYNPLCSVSLNDATATLFPAGNGAVYVNGRAAASNTDLSPGDIISFAHCDREFALIRVLGTSKNALRGT
ncbi:MAG: hypothetical protein OXE97_03375 [Gammaproteobacteria bacterium]|nr:hypothetical protein [Gammaproteobacteria bacterium]